MICLRYNDLVLSLDILPLIERRIHLRTLKNNREKSRKGNVKENPGEQK